MLIACGSKQDTLKACTPMIAALFVFGFAKLQMEALELRPTCRWPAPPVGLRLIPKPYALAGRGAREWWPRVWG